MFAPLYAYMPGHDRTYLSIASACLRLFVHMRKGVIAPMCAYTCGHDRAYVCMYVRPTLLHVYARSRAHLCSYTSMHAFTLTYVHVRLCMQSRSLSLIPLVCTCTVGRDPLCAHRSVGMITHMHIHALFSFCVHTPVCMKAIHLCIYTRGHDHAYVFIHV